MQLTAQQMADIHARSFTVPRPWSVDEIEAHGTLSGAIVLQTDYGFLLARHVVGEVELLTLAVDPDHRRNGVGQVLVNDLLTAAKALKADVVFLEVAEDNDAALTLYASVGFAHAGRRKNYYGGKTDALILRHDLDDVSAEAQIYG